MSDLTRFSAYLLWRGRKGTRASAYQLPPGVPADEAGPEGFNREKRGLDSGPRSLMECPVERTLPRRRVNQKLGAYPDEGAPRPQNSREN